MVGTVRRVGGVCSVEGFMNACAQTTQHTAMFCCAPTTIYVAAPRHVCCMLLHAISMMLLHTTAYYCILRMLLPCMGRGSSSGGGFRCGCGLFNHA